MCPLALALWPPLFEWALWQFEGPNSKNGRPKWGCVSWYLPPYGWGTFQQKGHVRRLCGVCARDLRKKAKRNSCIQGGWLALALWAPSKTRNGSLWGAHFLDRKGPSRIFFGRAHFEEWALPMGPFFMVWAAFFGGRKSMES